MDGKEGMSSTSAGGRPMSPQGVAEEAGVEAWALVTISERQEVRRLQDECRACVGWLDEMFYDLDDALARGLTVAEARAQIRQMHGELVGFHLRHYQWSIRGTQAVCEAIRGLIRGVNLHVGWWQGLSSARALRAEARV